MDCITLAKDNIATLKKLWKGKIQNEKKNFYSTCNYDEFYDVGLNRMQ